MKRKTTSQPSGALSRYALAFATAAAGLLPLGAAPIAIPNPSFESVVKVDGNDNFNEWANTKDVWRQWTVTTNGGPCRTWNPGASGVNFQGLLGYGFGGNAPDGQNVQIVRTHLSLTTAPSLLEPQPHWDGLNYFSAASVVLDGAIGSPLVAPATFDHNKIYKLTAKVGKPPYFVTFANGQPQNASDPRRPSAPYWHGYSLQLAAGGSNNGGFTFGGFVSGGTILSQDSNSRSVPVDEYRSVSTTYFPNPADDVQAGQFIQIRLAALENAANLDLTGFVVFDDVKLEEFAAPALAYWDLNDSTEGAGGSAPTGTWDRVSNHWTVALDGMRTTSAWTPGQTAVFSAGDDATDPYTVTVSGTQSIGGLSFKNGTVTLTGGTALELAGIGMIDVAPGLTATVATPLTEASAGLEIAKTGTGTLVLSGANTYSGGTTVLDGTLRLGASDVLADTSVVAVTGRSTGTALFDLDGNSDTVGGLVLGGSAADTAAAVSTGAGTLTLAGDVSYVNAAGNGVNPMGATISGNLNLGAAARAFLVNDSAAAADLAVSADITGSVAMTKAGNGTLVLSGNNAGATGGLTIEEGVVQFDSAAAINGTARDVSLTTYGKMAFGPSFGAGNIPTAMLTRIADTSDGVIAADNYEATDFDFDAAGLTAAHLGALGDVTYTGTVTPNGGTYRLGGGGGTLTLSGSNALTGSGKSLSIGGKVALTAANDYDGGTILSSRTYPVDLVELTLGDDGSIGNGPLTVQGGTIQSADSSTRTLANAVALNGTLRIAGTGDFNFTNTTPINLTATRGLTIQNQTTTIAAPFTGTGGININSGITINSAATGTLILQGNNTHTGLTSVNGGTVVLTGDNSSATGGTTVNGQTGQPTALIIGNDLAVGGTLTITTSSAAASLTRATIRAQGTRNVPNLVSANGDFSITGSDALTLSGTMTLTNNRVITNDNTTSPTTFGDITGINRTLTLSGDGNTTVNGKITTGTGQLIKNGTGTLTLNGANTYTGVTTVNVGKLIVNGSTSTGAVNVSANATLGGTGTIGGNISIADTGKLEFNLSTAPGSHDKLELAAGKKLTLVGAPTLTITSTGGTPGTGTYTLLTAPGGISGVAPATVNLPDGWTADAPQIVGNDLVINITSVGGVADPFDTWAAAAGLDGTAGKENGKTDDPDGDGKSNHYEFAFNGDPLDGSDNGLIAGLVQDTSDPADTNELTLIVAVRDGATFTGVGVPLVQTNTTPVDGLTYTIEGTLDLATIPGSAVSHVGGPSETAPAATGLPDLTGTDWEYHTFKLDASEGLGGKGFLRAKVE